MRYLRSCTRISWATRIGAAAVLTVGLTASLGLTQASAAPKAPARTACSAPPTVTRQPFGSAFDLYAGHNLPVFRYTLSNCSGMKVRILTYGGIIQSIQAPGANGRTKDVVLGFKTLKDYVA